MIAVAVREAVSLNATFILAAAVTLSLQFRHTAAAKGQTLVFGARADSARPREIARAGPVRTVGTCKCLLRP
jgi:hypothetical protein